MQSVSPVRSRAVAGSGLSVSELGFGGASVGNLYRASSDEGARAALDAAIACGLGHIDTAPYYGHGLSEARIGAFLADRGDVAVTLSTKVGRVLNPVAPADVPDHGFVEPLPYRPEFDYSYDGVMRSFDESCSRLGVTRVDIVFMHDIGAVTHGADRHKGLFAEAMDGGYRAMAELRSAGRTAAIGLGVNEWQVCAESFAHADFDVFMLAGRYTLLEQEPLESFLPECVKRGVSILCAGPFNSGLLARRPDARSHYNYEQAPGDILRAAERIFDICEAHGAPAQAAALQFPLAHPAVVSVVAGMASAARVRQTREWFDAALPPALWSDLKAEGVIRADAPTP